MKANNKANISILPCKGIVTMVRKLAIGFSIIVLIASCKKFVEVPNPDNEIQTEDVFENDNTAISALSGLYVQMSNASLLFSYGGLSVFCGLSSDEIYNTTTSTIYDPFAKNSVPVNEQTTNFSRFWGRAYTLIYQVNSVIEGVDKSTRLSSLVRDQVLGEAKFLRAFYYFYLVNLYGNVPLITTTDYRENSSIPRTEATEVYKQVINDLKSAQELLTESYPSTGKVRPNKWAATALLARAYLYTGDWVNAEDQASLILTSSNYVLENDLTKVYKINCTETIWELIPPVNQNTQEGITFIPTSTTSKPAFALTTHLFNSFTTGDQRKISWLKSNTVATVPYYYPFKYKVRSSTVSEYNIVFRLAEQYLIRAEARAQQSKITEAQADLNMIRKRAGLINTPADARETLLIAIENERQLELFAEWGHRWFDLKRTNRADLILGVAKSPYWQSTDTLFPIPFSEIQANPFLKQNDGYF
ncbi:RagB/SusD family nutrient uptake outer membrane protein [Longitalea luteola]|uniref:RagB/SusD family nutrient uptake outer membrane protein n=1 Tax=Longitalea luteola TaxID=2812563 RepID=UPI001A9692BE|nr:RagB/SusD family nutrient uptake outer membrane protein [Longitalea luteola]